MAQSVPRSEDPALVGPPPVPSGTQCNGLIVPGRKSSKSSNSDAFAIMMRARQGETKLPIRSTLDKGKQKDVGPAPASSVGKGNMSGPTVKNGGPSSKLRSRMRPREKPRVEPVLKLSVPPEPEPETDDREVSEQSRGDHEPIMGHEMSDSMLSVEKPSLPATEPPSITETLQQPESESGTMDSSQCDIHPTITSIQKNSPPLDLPGEQIHRPPQEASSIEKLPEAELEHVTPFASQDMSVMPQQQSMGPQAEKLPEAELEYLTPITSQDINEKALAENTQDAELQEKAHMPIESTEIEPDQQAEGSSTHAGKPSQVPEVVGPVPKASSRRAGRSSQRKLTSTAIPVGRVTRSAASKMKTTEPSVARSG